MPSPIEFDILLQEIKVIQTGIPSNKINKLLSPNDYPQNFLGGKPWNNLQILATDNNGNPLTIKTFFNSVPQVLVTITYKNGNPDTVTLALP